MIQRILHFDFPGKWPSFMDVTLQLLHANNPPSVLAGLQCLLVTCRAYRFKGSQDGSRDEFDKIVEASFPRLLEVCNELVNQESEEAGEMLHIALKAYKHATWVGNPPNILSSNIGTSVHLTIILTAGTLELPEATAGQPWVVHRLPKHNFQSCSGCGNV